jgi:hypothetical protein
LIAGNHHFFQLNHYSFIAIILSHRMRQKRMLSIFIDHQRVFRLFNKRVRLGLRANRRLYKVINLVNIACETNLN